MTGIRKSSEWNLLWWILASAIGFAAASSLTYILLILPFFEAHWFLILFPAGIILGTAQWLVIERFLPRLWLWVPATIPAGFVISFAVSWFWGGGFVGMGMFIVPLFIAPLSGVVIGVGQYLVLRRREGKENAEPKWMLLSLLAWTAGFWIATSIAERLVPFVGDGYMLVIIAMTTAGLVVGLITMLGWRRLLPDSHIESQVVQAKAAAVRRRLILLWSFVIVGVIAIGYLLYVLEEQTILAPASVACEGELVALYESGERDFSGICLIDSDLSGSHLVGIVLAGADIQNVSLARANLSGANLSGARLDNVDLTRTNFAEADLRDAMVINSSMERANFSEADMRWAHWNFEMDWADLSGANLSGATLTGRLYGANMHGTIIDENTTMDSTYMLVWEIVNEGGAGRDLSEANLVNADLSHSDLRGADLTGQRLTLVNLTGANLTGADLTGADLTSVNWSTTTCPDGTNSTTNGTIPGSCEGHLIPIP